MHAASAFAATPYGAGTHHEGSMSGKLMNQAVGLARLAQRRPVKVIAVTSGKGGVGKTSVSVNLAMALAMAGRETLLLDADLGLANVDVMLGLQPGRNLGHLLAGECGLEDLLLDAPHGLKVIPATSGTRRMAELGTAEHAGLIRAFSDYARPLDVMVVDTAAGIAESVTMFSRAAQEVVVVVCDEPASITDAYALIKVLSREFGVPRFRVVANMVRDAAHGRQLFETILRVTDRFLQVALDYVGAVPDDEHLRRAIRRQRAVVDAFPGSRAAVALKNLALAADKWDVATGSRGHLEFFVERLTGTPAALEA